MKYIVFKTSNPLLYQEQGVKFMPVFCEYG